MVLGIRYWRIRILRRTRLSTEVWRCSKGRTRDEITAWRKAVQAADDRAKKEQERQARKPQDQLAARQAAIEAKNLADRQAADELQELQQAGLDCDRLGANPTDQSRKADGVTFDVLGMQADAAFDACANAVKQFPNELRYQYQLGRAAQFKDKKKAFELFTTLTNSKYAAAFDNLGGMYADKNDIGTAARLYQTGAKLGDANSMVSLAALIEKGYLTSPDASNMRLALLKKAAELGHAGAQRAFGRIREGPDRPATTTNATTGSAANVRDIRTDRPRSTTEIEVGSGADRHDHRTIRRVSER